MLMTPGPELGFDLKIMQMILILELACHTRDHIKGNNSHHYWTPFDQWRRQLSATKGANGGAKKFSGGPAIKCHVGADANLF